MSKENKRKRIQKDGSVKKVVYKPDLGVWDILTPFLSHPMDVDLYGDILEYPWKSEKERIRDFSRLIKDLTIAEAFKQTYDIKVSDMGIGNELPASLGIGSIVPLRIKSISKKGGVIFDSGVHKYNFITRNNLASFPKLIRQVPDHPVNARVMEIRPDSVVVDIFGPMVEEFILPRVKTPWIQNCIDPDRIIPVRVKNLHLVKGGYMGQAVIPNVSEFVGADYVVEAFIPGSQIVQNTTDNFEQFEGATVDTFIVSWTTNPRTGDKSLICSAKQYIKHLGHLNLKEFHGYWCEQGDMWKEFSNKGWNGKVTGVINSSRKCGVFVEIPSLSITGLIPLKPDELVAFPAGMNLQVHWVDFDEEMYYNPHVGQYQHLDPFELEGGCIRKVNVKPILKIA